MRINDTSMDSPMRVYLDAFMKTELPKILPPREISVLDIGCGTAYTRTLLAQAGYRGSYTGVDIVREPKFDLHSESAFATEFENVDITQFSSQKKFDLVISNTSLEHIADDAAAVAVAHRLCAENGVEVHIVPSLWSLPLYLWHGYRQYTPARIRKLFTGTNYRMYRMGGLASWLLHLCCVTLSERIIGSYAFRKRPIYMKLKRQANRMDTYLPIWSVLYAVVVFIENIEIIRPLTSERYE
jgi:SAM-dependent methyltransferase